MMFSQFFAFLIIFNQLSVLHGFQSIQPVLSSFHGARRLAPFHGKPTASQIINRGSSLDSSVATRTDNDSIAMTTQPPNLHTIQQLSETAIYHRGTPEGLQALFQLSHFSQQRLPYEFVDDQKNNDSEPLQERTGKIQPVRQLIPAKVTQRISDITKKMEQDGQLSTNLDSVDGLPSFHLNLVSNGKPLFPKNNNTKDDTTSTSFEENIQQLLELVEPYIYKDLLPQARRLGNSTKLQVNDVFLRRYGQASEDARQGISAHYDVFSKVTSVIAMDNVAADGQNGLYTTVLSSTNNAHGSRTSNHASLRRYFPAQEGDAVLHTWDVLHGVNVLPGLDRTSLIVWFNEEGEEEELSKNTTSSSRCISPWLLENQERLDTNDINQFVLASALESAKDLLSSSGENKVLHDSTPHNSQELYLKSAERGNTFALCRMGSICERGSWTSFDVQGKAQALLDKLRAPDNLPKPILRQSSSHDDNQRMAWQFWLEAAIRGNPSAQFWLADDLMACAAAASSSSTDDDDDDAFLLAAVLFGLAAQQGHEDAIDRLQKVIELEVSNKQIATQDDFENSAVVQTAQAAMMAV